MNEKERDQDLLLYIQESISRIEQYTAQGRESFLNEEIIQDAVLRRLETLADAASHLSNALKARHPDIPWRAIHGFRNVAAHAYAEVDLQQVWDTVEDYLPALTDMLDDEIEDSEG